MKRIGTGWIIHGFAALHVAVVLLCALLGWPDSLILTALTMFLTVVICLRRNLTVEFTAVCVVLVNILGYVLGIRSPRTSQSSDWPSRGNGTSATCRLHGLRL